MKQNDLLKKDEILYRVLDINESKILVINCNKVQTPKWLDIETVSDYIICSEDILSSFPDINDLTASSRKYAHERFTLISGVLPFIADTKQRISAISRISENKKISKQTIFNYLWLYLVYQNISALAPKQKETEKPLTQDEKNFRWALNKFYYTPQKNTLTMAYTLLIKSKYCDSTGTLLSEYPTFCQFRYFYRKHKKMQNLYISRDGLKSYQRNNRPLLGNGIQEYAPAIGVGMLDSTVCDIYLVNDSGVLIGRPLLTACVDAYSGLCCGYSLSWEGGIYSLRSLMSNVITDKKEWCRRFGIEISTEEWNCNKLPGTLITDMGKEYASETFEQIADLGVTVINLPPYRPELKGAVEKFFDVVQNLYKPHLKGKGTIEIDFQERGAHDYRKDACLTMADFERIILRCIIHYNTKQIIDDFPYLEDMISRKISPYHNHIWNYGTTQAGANLIQVDYQMLILTLLPRTTGKFTRKGLIVNKLRYKADGFTEQYLNGGNVIVSYNPEDVSVVWLLDNGTYTPFRLIESRFIGKDISTVDEMKASQKAIVTALQRDSMQAKIDLANHISTIATTTQSKGDTEVKRIRENRQREQTRTHIDFIKDGTENE